MNHSIIYYKYYVAMWLCDYVAMWVCGYVAMWLAGWLAALYFRRTGERSELGAEFQKQKM